MHDITHPQGHGQRYPNNYGKNHHGNNHHGNNHHGNNHHDHNHHDHNHHGNNHYGSSYYGDNGRGWDYYYPYCPYGYYEYPIYSPVLPTDYVIINDMASAPPGTISEGFCNLKK